MVVITEKTSAIDGFVEMLEQQLDMVLSPCKYEEAPYRVVPKECADPGTR
jgi:hypothetical protein